MGLLQALHARFGDGITHCRHGAQKKVMHFFRSGQGISAGHGGKPRNTPAGAANFSFGHHFFSFAARYGIEH